ncbi:reverse transcriptase domain-containing protein [Tanacetum coccineum]
MSMSTSVARNKTEVLLNQLDLGVRGTIVGDLMHYTARGNIAHNFLRLKEGGVYSVKNFTFVPNKDEFRVMRFAVLMLEFDGETTVQKSFVKSNALLALSLNKYLADVAGYVTNVSRTTQTRTEDIHHVGLYPVVITVMSVKLYKNRLYLSSTSSTLIIDDEKILVLKRMKTDNSGVELTKEILPADNTTPKAGTLKNLLMWARNQKSDDKDGLELPIMWGRKCRKGALDRKEGSFWCDSCNISVEYPVMRFRLELEISDDTVEVVVVMFDETATSLLGL